MPITAALRSFLALSLLLGVQLLQNQLIQPGRKYIGPEILARIKIVDCILFLYTKLFP